MPNFRLLGSLGGRGPPSVARGSLALPLFFVHLSLCLGRPCFSSSDVFLFCWAAFLSISLMASVFPVSLPLFFLFFRPCLIHARMPEGGRVFVHGHTFLHSWSGPMTVVIGLLHGATFLSNLPLVLFVSFIGPWQLERTPIKPHLQLQFRFTNNKKYLEVADPLKNSRLLFFGCFEWNQAVLN